MSLRARLLGKRRTRLMPRRHSSSHLAEGRPLIRIPLFSSKPGFRRWQVRLPDGSTTRSDETLECGRTAKTCPHQHTKLNKLQAEKKRERGSMRHFSYVSILKILVGFLWRYTPGEPLSVVILIGKYFFCKAFRFRLGVEPFKKFWRVEFGYVRRLHGIERKDWDYAPPVASLHTFFFFSSTTLYRTSGRDTYFFCRLQGTDRRIG